MGRTEHRKDGRKTYIIVETCRNGVSQAVAITRKHTPQRNTVIISIHSKRCHNQHSYRKIGINLVISSTHTDVYVSAPSKIKISVSACYDWIYES